MNGVQLRELRAPQGRHTQLLGDHLARGRQPREVTQQVALGQLLLAEGDRVRVGSVLLTFKTAHPGAPTKSLGT